ncbi:hypothetical protein ACLRGI_00740 [Paenarthrobacter nitroguajacolicus]|uniref:hypothetical protein n=1 Tax=Paenarthrobacter nitroguajacolicus TaxID=211146 RepID=UPI003AE54667
MTEPQYSTPERPEPERPVLERAVPEHSETERPVVQWPEAAIPTGDPLVDRALGLLGEVPQSPVQDHGELFAGIHDSLLEALDSEPGLPAMPKTNSSSDSRPEGDS